MDGRSDFSIRTGIENNYDRCIKSNQPDYGLARITIVFQKMELAIGFEPTTG